MRECIILAGGMGTRLKDVVSDIPKCMVPIAGNAFLHYLISYLKEQDFEHVVFSLGYKSDVVIKWLEESNYGIDISFVVEGKPLGTGGAIRYSLEKCHSEDICVLNGDTMFRIDYTEFYKAYHLQNSSLAMAIKPMKNFSRYGSVDVNSNGFIAQFNEKKYCKEGLINGGIYILKKNILMDYQLGQPFSFEKDYLEKNVKNKRIKAYIEDAYFIDIGIPEDLRKAQSDFKQFAFV